MSLPTTRAEFAEYCLRRLGRPAIKINVTEQQVDDRIDEAILYWQDFNSDGTQRQYYKYQLQPEDLVNKYITLPENIIGVIRIFSPGDAYNIANIFNIRYQIALNDLYTLTSVSMAPYYMAFQHIQMLEMLLVGEKPIQYNRIANQLYLNMDWSIFNAGNYLMIDCYQVLDPAMFPRIWQDRLLTRYATALIKQNWGEQLKKFGNMQMTGGIIYNGQTIFNEATQEIALLEKTMRDTAEFPAEIFVG